LAFFARKSAALHIDSLEAARQVGAIAAYRDDYREQLLKSLGFTNIESSNNPQSNVRKLVSGRVDLWFHDTIGAPQAAREAGIDPGEIEAVFTYRQPFSYIAISKQTSPAIVAQWQATLAQNDADSAIFATTRLPQRETLFAWVGPLYMQDWGFYRWKGAGIAVADIQAAKQVARIGTYHQDAKMQYLQALGFENLVATNNNITNVTHLKRGNIDL
jgi:ABC-type amino acid transport substrate-binding protein